ncbi:MAG TPA: methionine aminotransferase [Steroidobacteraceae bacterium]|nr:methionine aminotransferase [Steroidobacteraceae bacterium]
MPFSSKLPDVGTTIFTVVTQRAQELGAINLAQGFPDYDIAPELCDLLDKYVRAGRNQYAPMMGVQELRQEIARKLERTQSVAVDPDREVTVTVGGTEALFSAVSTCVGNGDEAIVFDPAYDSYDPAIRLAGAKCVHVPLQLPSFDMPWERLKATLSPRTRLVILNNPHNPACRVLERNDLDTLAELLRGTNALLLSDEVYEHIVLDGRKHVSVLSHPELRERSFAVFSFGKTFHATGWRLGYCVAPAALTTEFRKAHQFNTFAVFTPVQYAVAEYLRSYPRRLDELPEFFARKRDLFCGLLAGSGLRWTPAQGTYFQLLDFSELSDEDDMSFADKLLREAGVASIPLAPFYQHPPRLSVVRFCFAKRDETLQQGAERLTRWREAS